MLTKHALNTSNTSVDLSIWDSYPPIPSKHILILFIISFWKCHNFDFGRLFHQKYQNHTLNDPFSSFHKITCMNIHKTVPNSWWVILRWWSATIKILKHQPFPGFRLFSQGNSVSDILCNSCSLNSSLFCFGRSSSHRRTESVLGKTFLLIFVFDT